MSWRRLASNKTSNEPQAAGFQPNKELADFANSAERQTALARHFDEGLSEAGA